MGYSIKKVDDGYEWGVFFSAYGAAGGVEKSLALAKVKLAIAQADILEHPFPPSVVKSMLEEAEKYAADYPDD